MASPLPADVLVRLKLSPELISAYELQAADLGLTLEEILALRLAKCVALTDNKPLYFNDEERQELESLIGKNVSSAMEVVRLIKSALSVKIVGKQPNSNPFSLRVDLKPALLGKLHSRCFGRPFEDFLAQIVVEELERYCGVR